MLLSLDIRKVFIVIYFISNVALCQNQQHTSIIYIKFNADLTLQNTEDFSIIQGFNTLQSQYLFTIKKGLSLSNKKIRDLSTGKHSLKNIFKIESTVPNQNIDELVASLKELPGVVYCYKKRMISKELPGDIPPITPSYEDQQGYLENDPGVDVRYAWEMGLTGSGIIIRDIEEGINLNHEELNDQNASIQPNVTIHENASSYNQEHGTWVAGVIYSDKGDYGTSGIAYGADQYILYPRFTQENGFDEPLAISSAIQDSNEGDIIIYEIQSFIEDGEEIRVTPSEFEPVIWDLTKAATDAGIIIVAAAGNGAQNLDSDFYQEYRDRGDSGAIIVGAGTPDIYHEPISNQNQPSLGNYGTRVDVQGWGTEVFTTGIGDIEIGNDINQSYRDSFNGTSSATAIVSGCVALLQSYYHDFTGGFLSSIQLRNLLIETGTPQGGEVHIGPLPNMENAIHEIQAILSIQNPDTLLSFITPNPSSDFINIQLQNTHSSQSNINIYNTIGEKITSQRIQGNRTTIDIRKYASGVYFLQIVSGKNSHIKKIIIH